MERTKKAPTTRNAFGLPDIGIPSEVLFHPGLTMTEKILFGFLRNLSQSRKGCWASNRYLGALIGTGPKTVTNSLKTLETHQFIRINFEEDNGRTIRRIFINSAYPTIYRSMVEELHEKLLGGSGDPLEKNYYPPGKKLLPKKLKEKRKKIIYLSPPLQKRSWTPSTYLTPND